jgi:hypothetical protein
MVKGQPQQQHNRAREDRAAGELGEQPQDQAAASCRAQLGDVLVVEPVVTRPQEAGEVEVTSNTWSCA